MRKEKQGQKVNNNIAQSSTKADLLELAAWIFRSSGDPGIKLEETKSKLIWRSCKLFLDFATNYTKNTHFSLLILERSENLHQNHLGYLLGGLLAARFLKWMPLMTSTERRPVVALYTRPTRISGVEA